MTYWEAQPSCSSSAAPVQRAGWRPASGSPRQAPASYPLSGVGHIKGQVNDAYDATFDQVWKTEVTLLGVGIGDDGEEAMTAFMERRAPRFQRR
jgi:2-(1,2-epoxy-1,2-dihydrophenyl)acetyl-CoA isomerase